MIELLSVPVILGGVWYCRDIASELWLAMLVIALLIHIL
jgi:hypothetical protein